MGHSFVKRMGNFLEGEEIEIYGHRVTFRGRSGAKVKDLMENLVGIDVANFCHQWLAPIGITASPVTSTTYSFSLINTELRFHSILHL